MQRLLCPTVVGRDAELSDLRGALTRAGDGAGSALFLRGEAGVGKTRLARETAAAARAAGCSVLAGRAVQGQLSVPFRAIAEALNSWFRDGGSTDLPELAPFRPILATLVPEWRDANRSEAAESVVLLAEAVLRLLDAIGRRTGGCLLVLEDLHWADPDTLSIVDYLAENVAAQPLVLLGTLRTAPGPALGLVRALADRRAAEVLDLRRLGPADTAAVARGCLATVDLPVPVAELLATHADGLPFFVEELLASAVESGSLAREGPGWVAAGSLHADVPDSFVDSVEQRLAGLGEAARVVVAAAVLGRSFDWALLPAVTGLDELEVLAALRAAVAAQLLADPSAAGSFRFRHALTRDAVVGRLLPMEQAALARRAVDAIEAAHPGLPGETCELAAELAERAGDAERAARLLVESGRRSLARGALASADAALGRARALTSDRHLAAAAGEALCEALSLAGNTDRTLSVGRELAVALEALDAPPDRRGNLELRLARAAATACRWGVATEHLRRGRAAAAAAHAADLAARLDAITADVAHGQGDLARAAQLAGETLAAAERLELPDLACEALEVIGRCARVRDLTAAEAAFDRARALAEQHNLTVWRSRALSELALIDVLSLGTADRLLAARDLAVTNGALAMGAHLDYVLAIWFLDQAQPERVIEQARRSGAIAGRFGMRQLQALALTIEGAAHGRLGRREEMEALLHQAATLSGDAPEPTGVAWSTARGVHWLINEDRARALDALGTAMESLRVTPAMANPERGLWSLLCTVEDPETGAIARAEVRASGVTIHRMNQAFVTLGEAVEHGRAGRVGEAEAAFADADAVLASVTWWRHVARRIVAAPAISDGWGDPVSWLHEALAEFETRGQDRLAAAARSLLQKAGAPVSRSRADGSLPPALREAGISRRELEVLTLLAEGLSNREIADRLYLSPRTVERHIANMTAKTGLRTRSALIAFAARNTKIG